METILSVLSFGMCIQIGVVLAAIIVWEIRVGEE